MDEMLSDFFRPSDYRSWWLVKSIKEKTSIHLLDCDMLLYFFFRCSYSLCLRLYTDKKYCLDEDE